MLRYQSALYKHMIMVELRQKFLDYTNFPDRKNSQTFSIFPDQFRISRVTRKSGNADCNYVHILYCFWPTVDENVGNLRFHHFYSFRLIHSPLLVSPTTHRTKFLFGKTTVAELRNEYEVYIIGTCTRQFNWVRTWHNVILIVCLDAGMVFWHF